MRALQAKYMLLSVCWVALLGVPAVAEIESVTFKTSRNTKYFWGSAISNLLRSQDGVEEVDNPYGNLQKGVVQIKTAKGKPIDLARLVQLLEEQVGFEPITEVSLEVRGRLKKQDGALVFEVSESGRTFTVAKVESKDGTPPEKELLAAVSLLENPHSPDRIILREWRRVQANESQP